MHDEITKSQREYYLREQMKAIKREVISPSFSGNEAVVEMDHMRKIIANHMKESLDVSAHVYVMSEIDMTDNVNFVKQYGFSNASKFESFEEVLTV